MNSAPCPSAREGGTLYVVEDARRMLAELAQKEWMEGTDYGDRTAGPHKPGCLVDMDSPDTPLSFIYLFQQAHHLNIGDWIAVLAQNQIQEHKITGDPNADWISNHKKNQQFEQNICNAVIAPPEEMF